MPTKVCTSPGCHEQPASRGRCRIHAKERDRSITRAGRLVYGSKRWAIVRRHQLYDNPLCEKCGAVAEDVHHVIPLADGGARWEASNLASLCHSCHARITAQEGREKAHR